MTIDADTFNVDAHFHGVKGLLRIEDTIITIWRDAKTFRYPLQIDLPGGGREDQESPFMTLNREVKEELGITLKESDIIYSVRCHDRLTDTQDTFFMVTKELPINPQAIVFGDKGLMFYIMTVHNFLHHPDAVEKQKQRVIAYLNEAQNTMTKE